MKKILFLGFIIISIIIIYNKNSSQKNLLLSFGNDYNGDYIYRYNDTRITDIINDIDKNIKIKNTPIQHLLIKATFISIDLNDLFNCNNYEKIIVNNDDLNKLIKIIRKYSKEKITIKLLEEKNEYEIYANKKIMLSLKKYDIMFVR